MSRDVARTAAVAAIVIGFLYLVATVNGIFRPDVMTEVDVMNRLASRSIDYYIDSGCFLLIAFLFIPVINAVTQAFGEAHGGWVHWAAITGYIGSGVTIADELRAWSLVPPQAELWLSGDEVVRTAIEYSWMTQWLDPYNLMQFGTLALWLLVVAIAALREGERFPRSWAYVSLLGAVLHVGMLLAILAAPGIRPFVQLAGGLITGPLWAFWTAAIFRRIGNLSRTVGVTGGV